MHLIRILNHRLSRLLLLPLAGMMLHVCSWAQETPPIWLMGEVHDNSLAHEYRLRDLEASLKSGWRPAILMEQFDVGNQAALTKAWQTCPVASCVVTAAGGKGWDWKLYEPLIQLALDRRLPLIAANLSREQLRKVMKEGFGAVFDSTTIARYGLALPLPQPWLDLQRKAIRDGHCNMLPPQLIDPMVKGQAARDVMFADLLARYAPQGAVLIAGNGHVRKDLGVMQWLDPQLRQRVTVAGYVEPNGIEPQNYDRVRVVASQSRPDPCAVFSKPRRQ